MKKTELSLYSNQLSGRLTPLFVHERSPVASDSWNQNFNLNNNWMES